ncbi:glycosyltransferase family 4 protein [Thalassotalea agariperforans]
MKKTLLISEVFPPVHGGSGRWFWELYNRLPKNEYVIAAGECEGQETFDKTHDLNLTRLNLTSNKWGLRSITALLFYWRTFWALKKIIKTEKITHIHCGRCLPEGFMGYLLHKFSGVPYISYIHGEDIEAANTSRELRWIVSRVLKNASTLICNSQNSQSLLVNNWPVDPKKTTVLNPGVDAEQFKPTTKDETIKKGLGWHERTVVLTVGRLQERKGQDMMIKALPVIISKIPNILYAIVGGGEEKAKLVALTKTLNIEKHVLFMSEVNDQQMIEAYQQCDIFILPNRTVGQDIEGFGMVLVEAQACGKPVIAGNSGGTTETMRLNETGYIIDCTQQDNISHTLIKLLNNRELLTDMGAQARQHVELTLDWKVHTQKAIKIFDAT